LARLVTSVNAGVNAQNVDSAEKIRRLTHDDAGI
jgi:hypothetical protein